MLVTTDAIQRGCACHAGKCSLEGSTNSMLEFYGKLMPFKMRYELPVLRLDQEVPAFALARRGGISFASSEKPSSAPRFERRGGISFDKSDKNAMYVRRLGDVKVRSKPESSRDSRRRGSILLDPDFKILENLEHSHYRSRCGLKFLSLHRVRRRRRGVLKCSRDNASILDDHYSGQAKCLLSTVGGWDFNVFNLDKLTNGRSLFHMCLHLFQDLNLISTFNLDIVKLMRCFTMIEEGYHNNNPYHNSVHAADVTQAMYCFLQEEKIRQHVTPLESMIALLSAATHDLDHPGVNQAFLIATSNPLATLYKNLSVLENHHWRSAVGVLHESGVFSHLEQDTRNTIEWLMKSLILATDITRQQEFLSKFKRHLENNDLRLEDNEHRHFTLQIILKCADICNPCKPWALSKQWSERVCDEFFKQGDYERKLEIPVTPLCDRYVTTVAKIQSGFMQFVVLPLFTEWANFNPTPLSHTMLRNIHFNKSGWDRIIQETEADKQKETDSVEDSSGDENCDINKENEVVTLASVHQEKSNSLTSSSHTDQEESSLPVVENGQPRRHSLPPPAISKDLKIVLPRRGSFPKAHGNHLENSSKLTKLLNNKHNPTSVEKLAKLDSLAEASPPAKQDWSQDVFSYDLDDDRPKITSLSFECQKGRLLRLGTHSAQVHPLTDQMVSYSQRYRHGRGSLPSIRLSQPSRILLKDLEDESSSKYNHHSQTDSLAGSATACKNTVIAVRHILGPLNTNAKMSMPDELLRHPRCDRPRSLSLDIDSQPLLRMHSQFNHHSTTAGSEIGEEEEISQCMCPPSQSNPIFSESQELLAAESLLREERTSASVPLLPEQYTSRSPGGCSHVTEQ